MRSSKTTIAGKMELSHGVCLQTLQAVITVVVTAHLADSLQLSCKKTSPCSCYLEDRGFIDLHKISKSNGQPAFNQSHNDIYYEWNPCELFTDTNSHKQCKDVHLCKYDSNNKTYTNLGSQAEFVYNASKDEVIMLYKEGVMETRVSLTCAESTSLYVGPLTDTQLDMTLFSPCACPGHCAKGLSPGSILCILFFSLVSSYFVVGALYRKTVYQSQGWDTLPHRAFWCDLPSLVRDGYLFFISPCLGNRVQYTMYQHVPGHDYEETQRHNSDSEDEYEQR